MTPNEFDRMRELPVLIQRARSSSAKVRLAHELRTLTARYRRESEQLLEERQAEQRPLAAVN